MLVNIERRPKQEPSTKQQKPTNQPEITTWQPLCTTLLKNYFHNSFNFHIAPSYKPTLQLSFAYVNTHGAELPRRWFKVKRRKQMRPAKPLSSINASSDGITGTSSLRAVSVLWHSNRLPWQPPGRKLRIGTMACNRHWPDDKLPCKKSKLLSKNQWQQQRNSHSNVSCQQASLSFSHLDKKGNQSHKLNNGRMHPNTISCTNTLLCKFMNSFSMEIINWYEIQTTYNTHGCLLFFTQPC